MEVYNYVSYAKAFELGVSNPNMTKIAKALFKPIIDLDGVVNRSGNMYTILLRIYWVLLQIRLKNVRCIHQ